MVNFLKLFLVAWMGISVAIAGESPFVSASQPHGVVDLDIAHPSKQQFSAYFLEVDGHNVVQGKQQLLLRPGKHNVKIGAKLTDAAIGLSRPAGKTSPENIVEIDVEEGVRYSVAAMIEGSNRGAWKAVVTNSQRME